MSEEKSLSPQGYIYNRDNPANPFWGTEGGGGDTGSVTATASVDNNTGVPEVEVTRTQSGLITNFDFAFHNLKGAQGEKGKSDDLYVSKTEDDAPILIKLPEYEGDLAISLSETETPGVYTLSIRNDGLTGVGNVRFAFIASETGENPALAISSTDFDGFATVMSDIIASIDIFFQTPLAAGATGTGTLTLTDCAIEDTTPRTVYTNYVIRSVPLTYDEGKILMSNGSGGFFWNGNSGLVQRLTLDLSFNTGAADRTAGNILAELYGDNSDYHAQKVATNHSSQSYDHTGETYFGIGVKKLSDGTSDTLTLDDSLTDSVQIDDLSVDLLYDNSDLYGAIFSGILTLKFNGVGSNSVVIKFPFSHKWSEWQGDAGDLETAVFFNPNTSPEDDYALRQALVVNGYLPDAGVGFTNNGLSFGKLTYGSYNAFSYNDRIEVIY